MRSSDTLAATFFALLRSGLYERRLTDDELPAVAALNPQDWVSLARLARQQTVVGLFYQAVTLLPETIRLDGGFVMELMACACGIEQLNRTMASVSADLMAEYTQG